MADRPLTIKQQIFVNDLITNGFNATQAAITAKYSAKTARGIAAENLTKPNIQAAITAKLKPLFDSQDASKERLIQELCAVAFTRLDEVCEIEPEGVTIKPLKDMPMSARIALAEVSDQFGTDGRQGVKIKMHDKLAAIEKLAKILRFIAPEGAGDVNIQVNVTNYHTKTDKDS